MKNINTTKIISITLLFLIISLSVLVLLNVIEPYNNIFIVGILALSIGVIILNFFGNTVIEKEIEVIVEKEVFIEKSTDKKEKIEIKKDLLTIIDNKTANNDIENYLNKQLSKIAKHFNLDQIVFYLKNNEGIFKVSARYAFVSENEIEFKEGEGLSGQVVKDKKPLYITDIPDGYITVISGLGKGNPKSLLIAPVITDKEVIGIAEFASLNEIEEDDRKIINKLIEKIATNIMNIK